MGRRDADERPPIEILGADPGIGSTQQVALGPRRPKVGRRRALAIVALLLAVLVGSVVLGGTGDQQERAADDEPRDNQDHIELGKRQTTSTELSTTTTRATTTTGSSGPLFGEPIDGVLLIHRSGQDWARLDLTTGALDVLTLPDVDLFNADAMPGGIVVAAGEEVRYYSVLGDELAPEGALLGKGNQVVSAGPDRLWLFDQPEGAGQVTTHARLVDLQGKVLREVEVPGYQAYASADEVLVVRAGRVYVAEDFGYRPLGSGYVNGVVGSNVLLTSCDDEAECALQLQPIDGGAARTLVPVEDPDSTYYNPPSAAPDGRLAIIGQSTTGIDQHLLLFDPQGNLLDSVRVSAGVQGTSPKWVPGDRGLLIGGATGLQWVRPQGDGWVVQDLDDGALGFPHTFFFVTP
jgi:hypothetical protein